MSLESQNEMISLLADHIRQKIILDIKQAGMFSVSADTTLDLLKFDQMFSPHPCLVDTMVLNRNCKKGLTRLSRILHVKHTGATLF